MQRWADEVTDGLGGWWTCFCLDRAVTWFGRYIENKLHETEKVGEHEIRQKYTLEQLLEGGTGDEQRPKQGLSALKRRFPGAVKSYPQKSESEPPAEPPAA